VAARYEDQALVDEFVEAADAGFDLRGAKRWRFIRQDQAPPNDASGALAAWQIEAEQLIRNADAVVCIAGRSFAESEGLKWELGVVQSLGKPTVVVAVDDVVLPEGVLGRSVVVRDLGPAEAGSRIDSLVLTAALAIREGVAKTSDLLEQYRLILETAERLEDRRQRLHTFFLSLKFAASRSYRPHHEGCD
jgi:nucleoside 2-deoxyribosyltransferase